MNTIPSRLRRALPMTIVGLALSMVAATSDASLPQEACGGLVDSLTAIDRTGAPPTWARGMPSGVWPLADAAYSAEGEDTWTCLLDVAERGADSVVEQSLARAMVDGVRAHRSGGRTQVRAADQLHQQLDTILQMEPDNRRARHPMGRLHLGVMRLGTIVRWIATNRLGGDALSNASWEAAEDHLEFAHRESPEILNHHFELARLYRASDRPELAREEIEHVRERTAESVMERQVKRDATELLEEIEG